MDSILQAPTPNAPSHRTLAIIPARWGSTRFPGKPLHLIAGKALIQHTWEQVNQCPDVDETIIATDDDKIAAAAKAFGAQVEMTASDHPSGTDRCAEVAERHPDFDLILNVQGDEPMIDPALIGELASALASPSQPDMVTAATPITDPELINDPNIVKVVIGAATQALYFSRSPIPYPRDKQHAHYHRHLGIYGFRRDVLLDIVSRPPTECELAEGLEQLRALHHGASIFVTLTEDLWVGIDTPEQAADLEAQLLSSSSPSTTP